MRITPLIISIIVFSGVMLGISVYLGGVQLAYNPGGTANSTTFEAFNQSFAKINQTMSSFEDKITGLAESKGPLDAFMDIGLATIDVLGIMTQLPNLVIVYISQILGFMPGIVPSWFVVMVTVTIVTIFVLKLVSVVSKTEEI